MLNLLAFISEIIKLPKEDEVIFKKEIEVLLKEEDEMGNLLSKSTLFNLWREEAREEGIEKGIEKGRIEEKISTAREMLLNGVEIAFVEKITKLPLSQLKEIQQSLDQ